MLERAKELLGYYYWVRLEGIVALWYCKSENPLINKIIDVMTEWTFNLKYLEETGKVLEENECTDTESRMIVEFFRYMINGISEKNQVIGVFKTYLAETENVILCEHYDSINRHQNELRNRYYSNNEVIKQEALAEFLLPPIRFKKEEKEIPMRGVLLALLDENTNLLN